MCLRFVFSGKADCTTLSPQKGRLDQGTGIWLATAVDDKEMLVILRSMKSTISHFIGDKNIWVYESRNKKFMEKNNDILIIKIFC